MVGVKTVMSLVGLLVAAMLGSVDVPAASVEKFESVTLFDDEVLGRVITLAGSAVQSAAAAVEPEVLTASSVAPVSTPVPAPGPTPMPVVAPAPGPTPTPVPASTPVAAPTPVPQSVVPAAVPAAAPAVADHQRRGQAALARVPVQPSALGFSISFESARERFGGLTWPDRNHIDIFVNPSWSNAHLVHVVAHEIGHALDLARNSRADHDAWKALRGMDPTTTWWAGPYTSDFASPSGDFAECFASWAVGSGSNRSHFGSCAGTGALMSQLVAG